MKKPIIQYQDVIINKRNINAYRSGRTIMFRGDFDYQTNTITIFRYHIDEKLSLGIKDYIRYQACAVRKYENKTLAHELKHFQNTDFGEQNSVVTNYYEICGLYTFDEVSAFAAEHIAHTKHPTHEQVCNAVELGIYDFLDCQSVYIPEFMQNLQKLLLMKTLEKKLDATIHYIERYANPPKRNSQTFNTIVDGYLTFNNQGIRNTNNRIPPELKERIKELQTVYENATQKILHNKLKKLQRIK